MEIGLQCEAKIHAGDSTGSKGPSHKAGLEGAGLTLNSLLEQWVRVETPGEATQGNQNLSVPPDTKINSLQHSVMAICFFPFRKLEEICAYTITCAAFSILKGLTLELK